MLNQPGRGSRPWGARSGALRESNNSTNVLLSQAVLDFLRWKMESLRLGRDVE